MDCVLTCKYQFIIAVTILSNIWLKYDVLSVGISVYRFYIKVATSRSILFTDFSTSGIIKMPINANY